MPTLRRLVCLAAAVTLLAAAPASAQDRVEPRLVKYAGLADEVLKHRGKVVLVDFWHAT
jgi:hypothetical protein